MKMIWVGLITTVGFVCTIAGKFENLNINNVYKSSIILKFDHEIQYLHSPPPEHSLFK